jgi:hypothetical protein
MKLVGKTATVKKTKSSSVTALICVLINFFILGSFLKNSTPPAHQNTTIII